MNNFRKSFALRASVATTFMHGSAGKIYKSHILRTAAITRTPSTRSLTVHVGHKISTQDVSKRRLWSAGTRSLHKISARSCEMILWDDHRHFTRSLGSRSLSYCMCHAKTVRGSRGHEVMFVLRLPCKIDVHVPCLPHGITHLRCATPGETAITSSRPNQPMPRETNTCKAVQLNHIDRCDRTSSCIHFP